MNVVDALVLVTEDNFDPKAYLAANVDVAARGMDPLVHWRNHGRKEFRRQLNLNFFDDSVELRREKYRLFKPYLAFPIDPQVDTFPITVGGEIHSSDDYQSESAGGTAPSLVEQILAHPDRLYMDLGCGLRERVFRNCLYVEVYPALTADLIVPPTCRYPIKDKTFDGISCAAVLEHTRKPWIVVEEMYRMLKSGGTVWIEWPFLQPVHGFPSHYYNATREGLRALFEDNGFHTDEIGTEDWEGPDYTITWIMSRFMESLPAVTRSRLGKMRLRDFLNHVPQDPFWKDILRQIDDNSRSTLASGNRLVATKRG